MFAALALGVSTMKQRVIMAYNCFAEACKVAKEGPPFNNMTLDLYDLCLYFTPVISLNPHKLVGSLPCQWD